MADKPKFFSDADLKILQRVIDREKRGIINSPPMHVTERWDAGEDHQAPETYVALPKTSDGIPASDTTYTTGDEPGAADCDIYQIIVESGTPRLRPVTNLFKKVYNVTGSALSQIWIPVTRDKFGNWLALAGGGSSVEVVFFVIERVDCVTRCAIAEVLARTCGDSEVGDDINVYDAAGCFFTGNEDSLVGVRGYAILMHGDDPCPGTGTWTGTGTAGTTPAGCVWHVFSLCCPTETC